MGSPLKIEIKDFQSLKHVNLELVDGVNIITGKTNQGKSAIIRAIDAAFFNMGDDSMIRGGKRYSGVSIDNGRHKLVFCRDGHGKNEKTAYQFDDNPIQKKVGRSQLPEVAKMFNVRDVRMHNNDKMKLNFWYQNDKPFLMDKTPGQLYDFLSLSSCDKYMKILKKMMVDMKVQGADINNITTEIDTLKLINNKKSDFISKNEGFDDLYIKVISTDQEDKKSKDILRILKRVSELSDRMIKCRNSLENVTEKYNKIPIKDIISEYESVINSYGEVKDIYTYVKDINVSSEKIKSVKDGLLSIDRDESKADKVYKTSGDKLKNIVSNVEECKVFNTHITSCLRVGSLVEDTKLKYDRLCSKNLVDISEVEGKINSIISSNIKLNTLHSVFSRIDRVYKTIETKNSKVIDIQNKLDNAERELEEIKSINGYCPFCGTIFSEKHNHI